MFEAKKQKKRDCIACYNAKRLPQIQAIPGGKLVSCPDITRCFAFCAMHMVGGFPGWSKSKKVCPSPLTYKNYEVVEALLLVVHKPNNIIFPFCIVRGKELENVADRSSAEMTDKEGLVRCNRTT